MTGADIHTARRTLGELWGLGRPLHYAELGRVLRLAGKDVGASVRDYERGTTKLSGPLQLALEALLDGWRPADLDTNLRAAGDA